MTAQDNTTKTDAEIYEDAKRRRWPYVDEPRAPRRRSGDEGVAAEPVRPRPLVPGAMNDAE